VNFSANLKKKQIVEVRTDGIGHHPKKIKLSNEPICHDENCKSFGLL
jgi:hypothetical protein